MPGSLIISPRPVLFIFRDTRGKQAGLGSPGGKDKAGIIENRCAKKE
jgi:hypothetical protein